MRSAIFLLLLSVLLANCTTTTAQTAVKHETKGSCLTAAPVCPTTFARNIIESEHSIMACFEGFTVCYGKTWNCLAIYEGDDNLIYFGDGDHFWIDSTHLVLTGTNADISINVASGTATATINQQNKIFGVPEYSGAVVRSN